MKAAAKQSVGKPYFNGCSRKALTGPKRIEMVDDLNF